MQNNFIQLIMLLKWMKKYQNSATNERIGIESLLESCIDILSRGRDISKLFFPTMLNKDCDFTSNSNLNDYNGANEIKNKLKIKFNDKHKDKNIEYFVDKASNEVIENITD